MANVKNGTCKSIGEVKSCTKAGTGCGGCMPLVQSIFNKTMLDMGQEVSNNCMFHAPEGLLSLTNEQCVFTFHTRAPISTMSLQSRDYGPSST